MAYFGGFKTWTSSGKNQSGTLYKTGQHTNSFRGSVDFGFEGSIWTHCNCVQFFQSLVDVRFWRFNRVGFLKIENKNLVIEVVVELWRFDFMSVQKFNLSETFNLCTKQCLNLTRKFTKIFSAKFKVWLILVRILWKVLLPKSKNRDKMSHRFQKLLKRHVSTFLEILYRTVVFLNVFVEEIFKI